MDTVWTIVNVQDVRVRDLFEELYLKCIIEGNGFFECEEFLRWEDLSSIRSLLTSKSTLEGLIPESSLLAGDEELRGYIGKETLSNEEIKFVEAHYLGDYCHLSKAISIFDSYIKRLENERRKHRSDNFVKVGIGMITAISTLFSVWFGYSLSRDKEIGESESINLYNACPITISDDAASDPILIMIMEQDSLE